MVKNPYPGGNPGGIFSKTPGGQPGNPKHQGTRDPGRYTAGSRDAAESRGQATHQDLNLKDFRSRGSNTRKG